MLVPAQRADDAAAALDRQIVESLLRRAKITLDLAEVDRTIFDSRGEMRRYGIPIDIRNDCLVFCQSRRACDMKRIAGQERAVRARLSARQRRLVVARAKSRLLQALDDESRHIRLADVRSRSRDEQCFSHENFSFAKAASSDASQSQSPALRQRMPMKAAARHSKKSGTTCKMPQYQSASHSVMGALTM